MNIQNILFLVFIFASPLYVSADENTERTINEFIESQLDQKTEGFKIQGYECIDLNNDNIEEIVFVWTLLGPTYWKNHLSVLNHDNGFTLDLIGEAHLDRVIGNEIVLSQTLYGPNDPICCPSIKKEVIYLYENHKLKKEVTSQ